MFGRVHDELTVENADGEVMKDALALLASRTNKQVPLEGEPGYEAYDKYEKQQPGRRYGFYNNSIAARMETLLRALPKKPEKDPDEDLVEKYGLMMQLLMALDGIPLIYMGDEWGEPVNWAHLAKQPGQDMRNVHRAIADKELPGHLTRQPAEMDRDELARRIHSITRDAIRARCKSPVMQHGTLDLLTDPEEVEDVLAFTRTLGEERVLVVCNLGHRPRTVEVSPDQARTHAQDLLIAREPFIIERRAHAVTLDLEPRQCRWLHLSRLGEVQEEHRS